MAMVLLLSLSLMNRRCQQQPALHTMERRRPTLTCSTALSMTGGKDSDANDMSDIIDSKLKVGDIVLCPGKWANEDMVAVVENTQVGPSLYGKTYSPWRQPIKRWFDVSEIRPARAEYVEEQDAWRVENARNFGNTPVVVNETARAIGLEEYSQLKSQILVNTGALGLAGSIGLALVDQGCASSFALGALASVAYISLLAMQVEDVRPGGAQNAGLPLLSPRFFAPLALFVALYFKFTYNQDASEAMGGFPKIPPREIASAAIGFLCYKIPLLYESTKEVYASLDDAGEGLESGEHAIIRASLRSEQASQRATSSGREMNPQTTWNPFTRIRLAVEQRYKEEEARKNGSASSDDGE
ncbi:hypothetical protein GUITHDRAFT_161025 [Guillardia theta CCMP2712]|uniref:Uncharacterized protein n=1 Tax=Guillardia theta (strain CCMP2712) TaxID=905079 RepID=L1JYT1_GUITC|nr:hypothetical protein GUITHDRAFT_161025 [Guillardia theta CCMP2712]EKX53355.1 hypothetical protein GUITHDRAFT_161025 [Guillardia theta CCMP2712]|eukprot:XP_005840335.1 hypothetical protein GUITHDRAFT_161025 [Guillardia theta CCMP2712]